MWFSIAIRFLEKKCDPVLPGKSISCFSGLFFDRDYDRGEHGKTAIRCEKDALEKHA
jgi:hypothetical protein